MIDVQTCTETDDWNNKKAANTFIFILSISQYLINKSISASAALKFHFENAADGT